MVRYGHPALRKRCHEIKKFTPLLKDIIQKMFVLMEESHGIGLAAPQIGLPWRLFVTKIDVPKVFINPILSTGGKTTVMNEGCLSLPGIHLDISRRNTVYITAKDENGIEFKDKYTGLEACCVQHENDHLNGILIIDYFNSPIIYPASNPSEEELQLLTQWENNDALGL
jgi:peptide deformylase